MCVCVRPCVGTPQFWRNACERHQGVVFYPSVVHLRVRFPMQALKATRANHTKHFDVERQKETNGILQGAIRDPDAIGSPGASGSSGFPGLPVEIGFGTSSAEGWLCNATPIHYNVLERSVNSFQTTPEGFEPSRAKPNGFLVHLLNHSDTVSYIGYRKQSRDFISLEI